MKIEMYNLSSKDIERQLHRNSFPLEPFSYSYCLAQTNRPIHNRRIDEPYRNREYLRFRVDGFDYSNPYLKTINYSDATDNYQHNLMLNIFKPTEGKGFDMHIINTQDKRGYHFKQIYLYQNVLLSDDFVFTNLICSDVYSESMDVFSQYEFERITDVVRKEYLASVIKKINKLEF